MTRRPLRTAVLCLGALLIGMLVQPAVKAVAQGNTYEKLGVFTRVLTYVENNYVEEVKPTDLVYGAIKGMLATLDPHSIFMTPEEYEDMKIDTGGEFGGIGLEVTKDKGRVVVVAPISDTPAAKAGLRAADVIIAIDSVELEGHSLHDVVRMMRGKPGSKVVLTIERVGFKAPRDIAVRRDHIRVNPVDAELVQGYGVIRIKSFQDRTDRYVRDGLARLTREAGGKLPGVVLDLRNNPGGLLDQAVAITDTWVEEGVIVSTRGRGSHKEVQRAHRGGTEPEYPLVVLVNGGSASASEIVAGALQDHGRAVIMGTQSFGKGSVQTVIDLEDGSGLKLTIARYYTPSGRSIQERGVTPDVVVEAAAPEKAIEKITREKDLEGHISGEASGTGPVASATPPEDYQLKSALDALKTWKIFTKATPRRNTAKAEPR